MRESITTIVVAIFASSGFWALIQFLINRNDGTKKELQSISAQVAALAEKVDSNSAVLARTHILRFDDELLNGVQHSKEYFRQQMDDIDTYEEFCIRQKSPRIPKLIYDNRLGAHPGHI